MSNRVPGLVIGATLLATILLAGCNGDSTPPPATPTPSPVVTATPTPTPTTTPVPTVTETPSVTETPAPTDTPSPTPTASPTNVPADATHPPGTTTGVPLLDRIIAAVEGGDAGALSDLVQYTPVPCRTEPPQGMPRPPRCEPGVPDGTPVQVFVGATCEGYYIQPDPAHGVEPALADFLSADPGLYAVIEPPPPAEPPVDWPRAHYEIVYAVSDPALGQLTKIVLVAEQGVAGIITACGDPPRQVVERAPADTWLLPPPPPQ